MLARLSARLGQGPVDPEEAFPVHRHPADKAVGAGQGQGPALGGDAAFHEVIGRQRGLGHRQSQLRKHSLFGFDQQRDAPQNAVVVGGDGDESRVGDDLRQCHQGRDDPAGGNAGLGQRPLGQDEAAHPHHLEGALPEVGPAGDLKVLAPGLVRSQQPLEHVPQGPLRAVAQQGPDPPLEGPLLGGGHELLELRQVHALLVRRLAARDARARGCHRGESLDMLLPRRRPAGRRDHVHVHGQVQVWLVGEGLGQLHVV